MANGSFYEAYVEVIPTAKGFERALNKEIGGASASAGTSAGGVAGGGFVAGFGKAIPIIGGVLAAAGLGNLISDAITNASDYSQAQGAVEDVFGSLGAQAVQSFADGGAKSVGQSSNDILSSASLLGIFGKAAGLADQDLVDFSTNLITLGADLSAFANTTPEEAVQALSAGLRGESEPLRKYGILLDDATLRNKALELGIYDGNGSLTQQQRILAANAVIFEQTATQQGKFAAESDTLAGKQAILAASIENISTKLGTAFLPIAEQVVDWVVAEMIPALEEFAAWLNKPDTQEGIRILGEGLKEVGNFARDLGERFVGMLGFIQGVAEYLNGQISFVEFMEKLKALPGPFGDIFTAATNAGAGVGNAIGGMISNVRQFALEVGTNVNGAIGFFQSIPGRVQGALAGAGSWLYNAGRQVIEGFVNGITSMVSRIYGAVRDTVGGAIDFAKDLLGIASPSKVFTEIGANTSKGFARGIEAEYSSVRSATSGMTSAAVDVANSDTYVQNPFTGDYLLAQVAGVAGGVVSAFDARQQRADNAGRRVRF